MARLHEHRKKRLAAAAEKFGGKAALGRALGFRDGAFVGQMLRDERPITEDTVAKVEALPGMRGWFGGLHPPEDEGPGELVVSVRDVDGIVTALAARLADYDSATREAVAALLAALARNPEYAASIVRQLRALLAAAPRTQRAANDSRPAPLVDVPGYRGPDRRTLRSSGE